MKAAVGVAAESRAGYFERSAQAWDSRVREADHAALERIFNRISFGSGDVVMDVGSGTGIAIPYYQDCRVKSIYAVECCNNMVRILREKFPDIFIYHQSYLVPIPEESFVDRIVIFNAFPHFEDFEKAFENSARYLKPGGILVISHSMNRSGISECHRKKGGEVALDHLPADEFFSGMFDRFGFSDIAVENSPDGFYSAGKKI